MSRQTECKSCPLDFVASKLLARMQKSNVGSVVIAKIVCSSNQGPDMPVFNEEGEEGRTAFGCQPD